MTETITRLFDSYDRATLTMAALRDHGFTDEQLSIIVRADGGPPISEEPTSAAGNGAEIGAGVGGVVGAGAGLLTGFGVMAIPGVGPVVAFGWLATTLAGAVAGAVAGAAGGGVIGSLMESGVEEGDAHVYAESIRRGGSLVTVRAPDGRATEARLLLEEGLPVDPTLRGAELRREGWERFDPNAPFYTRPAS